MVQALARQASALHLVQAEIARVLIVTGTALALICAGPALPF